MILLVNRTGALGDVVLATPVVRRLREAYPDDEIHVRTAWQDVFRNNPHVTRCWSPAEQIPDHDRLIDLDLAYEKRPRMHIVHAYMVEAFNDTQPPFFNGLQELFFRRLPKREGMRMIAVHAAKAGWRNRTLPSTTWLEVCRLLRDVHGLRPVLVGQHRDELRDSGFSAFHHPDLLAQATLIDQCDCFVGSDTGLLHVAGATSAPIVGVFTSVRPEYRLPLRDGCAAVTPMGFDCLGCHERQPAPATIESCERERYAECTLVVRPEAIVEAVVKMIGRV